MLRLSCVQVVLILGLIVAEQVRAQEAAAVAEHPDVSLLHTQVVQFLEDVSLGRPEGAFQTLLTGSPLARQTEAVTKLIDETRDLERKFGKYRAFERISAKRIGNDLVLMKYLYKCDNYPVVWYLTFYRDFKRNDASPESDAWILIGIRFDTELELLGFEK